MAKVKTGKDTSKTPTNVTLDKTLKADSFKFCERLTPKPKPFNDLVTVLLRSHIYGEPVPEGYGGKAPARPVRNAMENWGSGEKS